VFVELFREFYEAHEFSVPRGQAAFECTRSDTRI